MNTDHLRAAIERIGIEKPSDYTLIMEEVGRMEAEEKLMPCPFCGGSKVDRRKKCVVCNECGAQGPYTSEDTDDDQCELDWNSRPLLTASEAFIREAEEMGWGKTSDKALPGSWDALVKAVRKVKG